MMADHSGEDRLVPPTPNQPGTSSSPVRVAQKLFGLEIPPVQYSA